MAKKRPQSKPQPGGADLFLAATSRRRRALILPRYLEEEADKLVYGGPQQQHAFEIVKKWAHQEQKGQLWKKETAMDADFLHEIFGDALGYKRYAESPEKYHLQRNFTVPGIGTADAALGEFTPSSPASPLVVVELKGAETDLDRDKINGRTPVQQCWDYLNALPNCPWGIVSNFVTLRLYHRNQTPLAYQEFHLQRLRNFETFKQFYCLFGLRGLVLSGVTEPPAAVRLLARTENRQREVGDKLYETYSENRHRLIDELHRSQKKPVDSAIHIAQKILDRIIFIAFCEDRGLLPEKCIEDAYKTVPPFSKVTNPRWQNFINLFQAIDKGHETLDLKTGYNGGLFKYDNEVDNLQLDDSWTTFFNTVGSYDFRDEVNVDVLGHLFEKSVGELERLRAGAFFAQKKGDKGKSIEPRMQKSPERKRFGIFYTPAQFTQFIVKQTVGAVIDERFEDLRRRHNLTSEALESGQPSPAVASYWRDCFQTLREVKICDPACGSGAFLIQAYDLLELRYQTIADNLELHDPAAASEFCEKISDIILSENIHGVDLSEQAVEITQLALWIRSARRGKTLADLSHNIVQGNSLVTDPAIHPRAMQWQDTFTDVFGRARGGFDCVIGNPPWEQLMLYEREFFALSAPDIASALNTASRRRLIVQLESENPELYQHYLKAKADSERTLTYVRTCGHFPLSAKGRANTFAVFAELARSIVAHSGRVGLLVPSGIATDDSSKEFFGALIESKALISLYDFENKLPVFPDVHRSFKFCTLIFSGNDLKKSQADFVFFARQMQDLDDPSRHISLTSRDIGLLNPNTHTCPIFRSRHDADLTKTIYGRVPILLDKSHGESRNPWGVRFKQGLFNQSSDSELFKAAGELKKEGFILKGNKWIKGRQTFLPLYEAKMVQAFDHRAASVIFQEANWVRQGQTEETDLVSHQNPDSVAQPRWWVAEKEVDQAVNGQHPWGFLVFKDVTSPTNTRTMIAAAIPWSAVPHPLPIIFTDQSIRLELCLLANLNAFVYDFVARQKVGGTHLTFFIVEQLPTFPPDHYFERCPWDKRQTLEHWIAERVLKLTCTANDMRPLAETAGFSPPVHKWKPPERAQLIAELDAAFFRLYEISREDVEYILNTFAGIRKEKESFAGVISQADAILRAYDQLSAS
jgi:hypothetical protein